MLGLQQFNENDNCVGLEFALDVKLLRFFIHCNLQSVKFFKGEPNIQKFLQRKNEGKNKILIILI